MTDPHDEQRRRPYEHPHGQSHPVAPGSAGWLTAMHSGHRAFTMTGSHHANYRMLDAASARRVYVPDARRRPGARDADGWPVIDGDPLRDIRYR